MTRAQQAHLEWVLNQVTLRLRAKYRKGQQEHGGNLWVKPGLLEMAIDEVIDLAVYLITLEDQLGD